MPVYEFKCQACGSHTDLVMPLSIYERQGNKLKCDKCKGSLERTFTTPPMGFVQPDFKVFKSPIDNAPVASRRELDDHNRRHNVVHMHEKYTDKEIKAMDGSRVVQSDRKELIADAVEAMEAVNQGYTPTIESEDVLDHG